jgi:hypothetical protein
MAKRYQLLAIWNQSIINNQCQWNVEAWYVCNDYLYKWYSIDAVTVRDYSLFYYHSSNTILKCCHFIPVFYCYVYIHFVSVTFWWCVSFWCWWYISSVHCLYLCCLSIQKETYMISHFMWNLYFWNVDILTTYNLWYVVTYDENKIKEENSDEKGSLYIENLCGYCIGWNESEEKSEMWRLQSAEREMSLFQSKHLSRNARKHLAAFIMYVSYQCQWLCLLGYWYSYSADTMCVYSINVYLFIVSLIFM